MTRKLTREQELYLTIRLVCSRDALLSLVARLAQLNGSAWDDEAT